MRVDLPPGKKLVALTFDLCETPGELAGYDGAIVDILRARRIKATFFAGGQWMASHKTRTGQLLSDPLFEVGTHGWGASQHAAYQWRRPEERDDRAFGHLCGGLDLS